METHPYTPLVARTPAADKGTRPARGARLLALRQAAGLTQIELADFLDVPKANIAFWEWSEKPPRSDVLPAMAKALRVGVEEILGTPAAKPLAKGPGPVGEVQKAFEEVRQLPRKHQRRIIQTVRALVDDYKRRTG